MEQLKQAETGAGKAELERAADGPWRMGVESRGGGWRGKGILSCTARGAWLLAAALALGGCVHQMRYWPEVKGRFADNGEILIGSMTRYVLSGEGVFGFRTDRGLKCFGRFTPVAEPRGGSGTLACGPQVAGPICRGCSPEPSEPFSFVLQDGPNGRRGTGSGTIEGRRYTFTLLVFRVPDFWDGVPACLGPGKGGTEQLKCPG